MSNTAKWFNMASNALTDAWRESSGFERKLYGIVILGAILFLSGSCYVHAKEAQAVQAAQWRALVRADSQRVAVAEAYAKAVKAQVYHDTVRVVRTIHQTDSVYATLPETVTTPADTVRVVEAYPFLRAGYDSLSRSCSDLQRHALTYVSACDSIQAALHDQLTVVTKQLHAERPKWYAKPLHFLELGAVGYVGYRVGRGR